MDEIEWWEFDTAREMAAQAAGDIGFVVESAIEAHKGARIALPGGSTSDLIYAQLARSTASSPPRAPISSRWSMRRRWATARRRAGSPTRACR
jgi:6-phosphogluconolactonase/glucosamine-6-phosphate isomerase/deaminase